MAVARKCDRCGKLYELKTICGIEAALSKICAALREMTNEVIADKINVVTAELDLCPECSKSFTQWWKKAKNETD